MKMRKMLRAWLPCALWMTVIFVMSAMNGKASGEQSGVLARLLLSLVSMFSGTVEQGDLEFVIRKGAHLSEFALLFLLYFRALALTQCRRSGTLAFALTVCYAVTDEVHQFFVPGRSANAADVMIDAAGALTAWMILALVRKMIRRKKDV